MRAFRYRRGGLVPAILGPLAVVVASATTVAAAGDEPGLFGRLFRLGGGSSSSSTPNDHDHNHNHDRNRPRQTPAANPLPYGPGAAGATSGANANRGNDFIPPASPRSAAASSAPAPAPTPTAGPLGEGPSTPETLDNGSAPPISPRPRVSSAVTSADPLLTRVALGRSTDGSQFGMFLQVFADGTVIDSEGVHRVSQADIRPIAELVGSGELSRNRGHCGAPSGDFIEEVQVIVYERRLGRLTAQPFSYSGNPQDCDHSVKHLHTLIESLMVKLSGQPDLAAQTNPAGPAPEAAAPTGPANRVAVAPESPSTSSNAPILSSPSPELPPPSGPVIPLTPVGER